MRVLIVDDDRVNLSVLSGFMTHLNIANDSVESGPEAIKAFEKCQYDAVFIDYMMPDIDGIETSKIILSKHNTKIVLVTAHNNVSELVKGVDIKCVLYKPIKLCDVINSIMTLL